MHPLSHIFEGVSISNVIDDNDAVSAYRQLSMNWSHTSVIAARQSTESLLARCVPLYRRI
jgi:hypothetical protein